VRAEREKAVATRKEPITGTSEFPNINEADVAVLFPSPMWGGVRGGGDGAELDQRGAHTPSSTSSPQGGGEQVAATETTFAALVRMAVQGATLPQLAGTASGPSPVSIAPLPSIRTAEPFERLRDRADAYRTKTGERPKVFLANLGPISAFTARATFAKNFFEAGGIEAVMNDGFSDNDRLRQAYIESKAKLSCICSTDEIYEKHALDAAETLRSAGSPLIALAGRPGDREEQLTRTGITTFIYAGCDTLEVLSRALDKA
jgi:methylmalonyl-CoA mutase